MPYQPSDTLLSRLAKPSHKREWGGVVHFNLCGGGETLLPPEIIAISREILAQGHYIAIITNGTATKRFKEICQFPEDYRERILFKFSFHYLELKKRKLLEKFFDNVNMMRQAGCSISVELTPSDIYIPYIQGDKRYLYGQSRSSMSCDSSKKGN